ncbi:IclR family transcriptional regulator [Paraburkholderia sp.]|uniref:IclR family transcriptional regulator n=1 Tax=Paraburkholderia sp. TaxID=1926495 RepID=UPI0039E3C7BD
MSDSSERTTESSNTVERSFRLLRFIAEGGQTKNVSEAARQLGVNRITLMRLIASLEALGLIVDGPAGHRLGLPFLTLASAALGSSDLIAHARAVLPELAASTRMSAYLVMREDAEIVYSLAEMPDTPLVSQIRAGSRLPAYRATPGLAMLALLDDAEIERMCTSVWSEPDAPSFKTLSKRLAQIRADGCAWSHSGLEAGIDSCAAPIVDAAGNAVAALSIAGPSRMFADRPEHDEALALPVKRAATQISKLLA